MDKEVLLKKTGRIARITLNRPKRLNAFTLTMAESLKAVLEKLQNDTELRVILLQGEGRAFSAGGDIQLMSETKNLPEFFDQISQSLHQAVLLIRRLPLPVIAVCNGPVSGVAFGLVVACDLRLASEAATFHAGTTRLGLAPNGSLTYYLPRLIGRGRALQMLTTANKISAREAYEWGLVSEVATPEELESLAITWAETLSEQPPVAIRKVKELCWAQDVELATQLDREREAISASAATEDFQEGIAAFLEKRNAVFKGS